MSTEPQPVKPRAVAKPVAKPVPKPVAVEPASQSVQITATVPVTAPTVTPPTKVPLQRMMMKPKAPGKPAASVVLPTPPEISDGLDPILDDPPEEPKKRIRKPAAKKTAARKPKAPALADVDEVGVEELPDVPDEIPDIVIPRKPGRPRKPIKKNVVPFVGLATEAVNHAEAKGTDMEFILEILYDNPVMYKKIIGVFKSHDTETVRVRCTREHITFYAENASNHNHIYARVEGRNMSRYYCAYDHYEIGLKVLAFSKVLDTMTGDNSKIQINVRKRYEHQKIKLTTTNDELEDQSEFELDILHLEPYDWCIETVLGEEPNYPISFHLPAKYAKKKVGDFKTLSDTISIERVRGGHVRMSTSYTGGGGRYDLYFKNPERIGLRCTVGPKEIFSTTVLIGYIRSFCSSLVSDELYFSADRTRDLILTAYLDQELLNKKPIPGTERGVIHLVSEIVRDTDL
jgi:hypothetical protein